MLLDCPSFNVIADRTVFVRHRLPAIYYLEQFVHDGGLMAYGPDQAAYFRRIAWYIGRILNGDKPAELPVEQPRELHLIVNMKTAKALGLTIPPSLLLRADQVIE
jgi:putative ABC transport system substrate-binding protein